MKIDGYRRCSKGLWDTTVPGVEFDENGVSNYYYMFQLLQEEFPAGDAGKDLWDLQLEKIRQAGRRSKYDCVVGVSGGTDSSYLLHLAVVEWGLRPLAVYLDNGWSSDTAVKNIKLMVDKLGVDLETHVIDYEEVKTALTSYMRASLPWIDGATDRAIKSSLFKTAAQEGIKTILVGTDFRSEGKQPEEWTHNDSKLFSFVTKTFGKKPIRTYPNMSLTKHILYGLFYRIRRYQPFYLLNYNKAHAQAFLEEKYRWEYYGGHHHENLFTKFAIAHWLYQKFNIDKRIITLSAQVISGAKDREEAIAELKQNPYTEESLKIDLPIVLRKLDLSDQEFSEIWSAENKTHHDYPSYYQFFMRNYKVLGRLSSLILPARPKMFIVKGK